jgi:hemerythrin superfamily protein
LTEEVRKDLDALDLLMQDHREVESLFRDFEYLKQSGRDTSGVMLRACAELKMHDTLETEIFYAAVDEATDDEDIHDLLDDAEDAHDRVLELIESLEQTADAKQREAHFTRLAERVTQHVREEEDEVFPLVRTLTELDLASTARAMKSRKAELIPERGSAEAGEETV